MSSYLVNAIPDIENKRYLELGTFDGNNFSVVRARDKTGVDFEHPTTYIMKTDLFFETIPSEEKWDIIYIDADHNCLSILKDFNNSVRHLAKNGIIFLHDMFPPSEELTKPWYCGSGYIFLDLLRRKRYKRVYTQNPICGDYGLTAVLFPKTLLEEKDLELNLKYKDFISRWDTIMYTIDQMQAILRGEKVNV